MEGKPVVYICEGSRKISFGRIVLNERPVRRVQEHIEREATDLTIFLQELAAAGGFRGDVVRVAGFAGELEQTLLKEAYSRSWRQGNEIPIVAAGYDELEGLVIEGHPYHPCFKSRIGFHLDDNRMYGPEFQSPIRLIWLAVRSEEAELTVVGNEAYAAWAKQELGEALYNHFIASLTDQGYEPERYVFVPVHPWQWRNKAESLFFRCLADGRLVWLGEGEELYVPQQSLRTLSNRTKPLLPNVKLALNVLNTSSVRTISPRHARGGVTVTERLLEMVEQDTYLRMNRRLIVLRETASVTFRTERLPGPVRQDAAGMLGAIWRDSVQRYLGDGEEAVPFTALCHTKEDGRPFIEDWVRELGVQEWLTALLDTVVPPLVHLLYAHGVAIEAHAQNLSLVHRKGIPVSIAVKDFSGGVLIYCPEGADPGKRPETEVPGEARDVLHNALFFVNLTELAHHLERHYGFGEGRFWQLTAEAIYRYQRQHPELTARFAAFDLFEPAVFVGRLAWRRLSGNKGERDHYVPNALHAFKNQKEVNR